LSARNRCQHAEVLALIYNIRVEALHLAAHQVRPRSARRPRARLERIPATVALACSDELVRGRNRPQRPPPSPGGSDTNGCHGLRQSSARSVW
jgi:hypothetical protein